MVHLTHLIAGETLRVSTQYQRNVDRNLQLATPGSAVAGVFNLDILSIWKQSFEFFY